MTVTIISHYPILIFLKIPGGQLQNLVSPMIYTDFAFFLEYYVFIDGLLLGITLSQNFFKEETADEYTQATKQT